MQDISRRQLLSWAVMAPLVGATASAAGATRSNHKGEPLTQSAIARQRIQRLHLPNVPLVTHEGKRVLFYDDLVRDKIVTLNFFYAKCDEICPLVTANLAKVQKLFGGELGRSIFMYSFTLKPQEDDVSVIKDYRNMHGAKPGWTFLTGKPDDMEKIRKGIGFTYPDPAIDKDKTQHIGNVRYGNEPLMLWAACPGMARTQFLYESILWGALRPDANSGQRPDAL